MTKASDLEPEDAIHRGPPVTVDRYGPGKRVNHWITASSLILLALSGLAMFHPSLFFLIGLFGGGQNTRMLHPWIGVVLFFSFYIFFFQLWKANLFTRADMGWFTGIRDVIGGHEDRLPEMGKYNAGQKVIFWAMALLIVALIITGVIIWDQYFYSYTSIETKRFAVLAHAVAAVLIICVFIVHVYAAFWTRGTFRAMTKGSVTGGWAWRHHRKWLKELAGRGRIDPAE
ncbi:formate dehydrogenase subunit gamma [Sinorhizobium meliloti]|uniref:formate dehydrogenase subunit gamma n=1 Tax=Rhizobium meliloti TaxID=382 RepID=UPI000B49D7A7|nr:formate dehydrogenase subunit gamma [Sinorhizobium meliloti]ASQ06252.1 formate dehydrogenase subunit gamma [Sinorhizobium meliloti]MDW9586672.1 formate dehydrogenase subunit gamma [Sinorhizobium meliloti]MDX0248938.1 formate dehydrogenase subunit gamma [Sinorhizobium meliloti]MQU72859.1 formate dehydrogenase subunit gamma [Sinorhizobium meliloti]MQV41237.1 formate dehydrogenase subunit gamma [Sinorhizobium meliloti]